jgi:hypothetical protein
MAMELGLVQGLTPSKVQKSEFGNCTYLLIFHDLFPSEIQRYILNKDIDIPPYRIPKKETILNYFSNLRKRDRLAKHSFEALEKIARLNEPERILL